DYAGPAGSLNIDIAVFDELWPRRGSRDLVLWTEGNPETVITQIRERAGGEQSLFFVYGDDLARFASRLLSRFQGILASVSIMTSLLGLGATRRQVRALTLIDGLLLGVGGGIGGMLLGVCSAYPIVSSVVADSVGWSLAFSVAPLEIVLLTVGVLAASLLASLYPARVAADIPMREASGAE